jgi:DNA-binding transcriptional LysR family regulator
MNELDIRLVRCFAAVADERSFTRASERLRIAQPWLSAQIRKLEEQLGFQLFDRNRNRAVTILPEGEAFLPLAHDYLVAAERAAAAARRIRDQSAVLLNLGAPDFSADMPVRVALVEDFLARHPKFDIEISNAWTVELLQRLGEGKIDLAFTVGPHVDPYSEALVLARYRLALLVANERVGTAPRPLPLSRFAGEQVAIFRRNVNPAFHDSIAPILEAAGIGVAYLPESGFSAIMHFAQRSGIPALVGEWQGSIPHIPDSFSVVSLDEPALAFNLNLVRRVGDRRPAVTALWTFATRSIPAAA